MKLYLPFTLRYSDITGNKAVLSEAQDLELGLFEF